MAGRYNRWLRAKLADRIEANGGYHRGRNQSFALSWCVRYYGGITDAASAVSALIEGEYILNEADLHMQCPDFEEKFTVAQFNAQWENAQEHLQEDLMEDEGLRMWSPDTAKKYGFGYVGPGADRPFNMKLAGYGGGGKHVCLVDFEGCSLQRYNRDLADDIRNHLQGESIPNVWCRKLMGIMDELDEVLTEENAKRCGRFYEADHLARELGLLD